MIVPAGCVGWPRMLGVRQGYPASSALRLPDAVVSAFGEGAVLRGLAGGARVAVAVGSRGIDRHAEVVGAVIEVLRGAGHHPFLVPAMGSHGGGTAEGQVELLRSAGIRAEALGVPVEAGMEAELVGRTDEGAEVFCAASARRAAGIVLVNRVKPHTDFGGAIGSGLLKMAVVGLGKHAGATSFHRAAQRLGYERALRTMAHLALREAPILCGVALIEDFQHRLGRLEVVSGSRMEAEESRLAAEAARWMPRLPLDEIDLLIVDRMGKDVSGTGMDPNVIGRTIHGYSLMESEMVRQPRIRRIFVRDLTPGSHGNATGLGMADFATRRLVQAMDARVTYTNALTALSLQGSKVPIHFDTDRECIRAALDTLGLPEDSEARVVRIRDTLSLGVFQASAVLADELGRLPGIEITGPAEPMAFGPDGNLPDLVI